MNERYTKLVKTLGDYRWVLDKQPKDQIRALLNLVANQVDQIHPKKKVTPDQRLEILQLLADALNNLEAALLVDASDRPFKQADSKYVIKKEDLPPDVFGEYRDN